jgi:hypothetical protein
MIGARCKCLGLNVVRTLNATGERVYRFWVIKMDYKMTDSSIRMRVRAAVEGYMLLRWGVDSSPDHRLKEQPYRLWLSDPLALYGVENAKLAPGYQAPAAHSRFSNSR